MHRRGIQRFSDRWSSEGEFRFRLRCSVTLRVIEEIDETVFPHFQVETRQPAFLGLTTKVILAVEPQRLRHLPVVLGEVGIAQTRL